MGFQEQMMKMWIGRKKPEELTEIMPQMMEQFHAKMGAEGLVPMMHETMPTMMDSFFTSMDDKQRREMIGMCREMLNQMEAKYMATAA